MLTAIRPAEPRPTRLRPAWWTAGCGPGCRQIRATVEGTTRPLWLELHEPTDHERAAEALTVVANEAALEAYSAGLGDGRAEAMTAVLLLASLLRARAAPAVVRTGRLVIDRPARSATVDGETVPLSGSEWAVLELLSRTPGEVLERDVLVAELWPDRIGRRYGAPSPLACQDPYQPLRMLVGRLRTKLGRAGRLVETRTAVGYLLRNEPPSDPSDTTPDEEGG